MKKLFLILLLVFLILLVLGYIYHEINKPDGEEKNVDEKTSNDEEKTIDGNVEESKDDNLVNLTDEKETINDVNLINDQKINNEEKVDDTISNNIDELSVTPNTDEITNDLYSELDSSDDEDLLTREIDLKCDLSIFDSSSTPSIDLEIYNCYKEQVCTCDFDIMTKIECKLELDCHFETYIFSKLAQRNQNSDPTKDKGFLITYAFYILQHFSFQELRDIKLREVNNGIITYTNLNDEEIYNLHLYIATKYYNIHSTKKKIEIDTDYRLSVLSPDTLVKNDPNLDTGMLQYNRQIILNIINRSKVLLGRGLEDSIIRRDAVLLNNVEISAIEFAFILLFKKRMYAILGQ